MDLAISLMRSVGEAELVGEVHIALRAQGYQMYMSVRHFKAQHRHAYLAAGDGFFDGLGHTLCKYVKIGELAVVEVEDIVYLALGYNQYVTFGHGVDVEECVVSGILGYLI